MAANNLLLIESKKKVSSLQKFFGVFVVLGDAITAYGLWVQNLSEKSWIKKWFFFSPQKFSHNCQRIFIQFWFYNCWKYTKLLQLSTMVFFNRSRVKSVVLSCDWITKSMWQGFFLINQLFLNKDWLKRLPVFCSKNQGVEITCVCAKKYDREGV